MMKGLFIVFLAIPQLAFASSGGGDLPIITYLQGFASDLTRPLPIILGIIGLSLAALNMFAEARGGESVKRMFGVAFGVGAALKAPDLIASITGFLM